ncbi:MAG: general secretion pathway protein A [Colwellia sp.]|jgi:general secretion pathway protein A
MYTSYFGLEEKPFSIAPNPDYLFMSDRHREALNHLTYGLGDTGGFVLLTGEVGTGKTTISRRLMENLPENTQAAFILNPTLSSQELLATLCDELKIRYRKTGATLKTLTDKIQQKLLKNHSENINTLLIIDEAQHLQPEVLEQLRLLTNLETNTKKLLQVILIGQPELQQLLQRRDLRQLAQRITARYHLLPLNKQEVAQYLKHRLSVAKCFREIFDKSAVNAIHKTCKGIPRLMNLLAERSLMNAYNSNNAVVNRKMVLQAAYDALGDEFEVTPWWKNRFVKVGGLVSTLGIVLVIGVWWGTYQLQGGQSALHLTAAENEADIKVAKTVTQEKTISVVDNNANALVQNTVVDTQALINEKTVSDNETVFSNNNIGSTKLVDTAKQQLLATNKKILAAEKKLASLQVAQQQSADDFIEPEKKVTPKNFVVEAEAGVSDALLASFQSAIEETKQDEQTIEKPVVENSDLIPLTQMPVWVQDGVPSIAFEMHIYASDGQGWVRVNGRDRYEGDYIGRELLLNEILPQKVVLSFRGEKFTMGALTSWN